MTTKRKRSQATGREGINFVRSLVERQNSTFQEIAQHNDIGNDAYVEFVVEESATGCCVALQIKSGSSYRNNSDRYFFQSDRDHFEYWASHVLPVLAVIYDPERDQAVWMDITEYIRANPSIVENGPYSIYADQDFSESTFSEFRTHCLNYREQYSRDSNFGHALESLSIRDDVEGCFDGLHALFAFHRHQTATWYYLISCLSNYRGHPILRSLVIILCHVPGHGDIYWGKHNIIAEEVRRKARAMMNERFDRKDAIAMLSVIDEAGIDRGTIGQCVHALIDTITDTADVMETIATDDILSERIRHSALLFAVCSAQAHSATNARALIERIRPHIDVDELNDCIDWLDDSLRQYGYVSLY